MVDLVLGFNFSVSLRFRSRQFAPKFGVCPMVRLGLGLALGVSLRVELEPAGISKLGVGVHNDDKKNSMDWVCDLV